MELIVYKYTCCMYQPPQMGMIQFVQADNYTCQQIIYRLIVGQYYLLHHLSPYYQYKCQHTYKLVMVQLGDFDIFQYG